MNKTLRLIRNILIFHLGVPILVLFAYEPGWAANHYVRAAATGSGNGSDWMNACPEFTGSCAVASLVRGDTYYVASGTYASRIFNTPVSGTLVITIKGATAADHGTDTGWSNAFGVDVVQASFGHGVHFGKSYFTFDGSVGPVRDPNPAHYGFKIAQPANCSTIQNYSQFFDPTPATITNIIYKHVAIVSCGAAFDVGQSGIYSGAGGYASPASDTVTIANCYISGTSAALTSDTSQNVTFEYNYVTDSWSTPTNHGVQVRIRSSVNTTTRYNYLKGARGTATVGWYAPLAMGHAIYGNIVEDAQGGNGVFASGDSASLSCLKCLVYNNTIVNSPTSFFRQGTPSSSGNVLKNNLLWNSGTGIQGDGVEHDYNSYLSVTDTPATEANGQIASLDPFVDSTNKKWRLANGTSVFSGISLSAPYNVDAGGLTRGSDEVLDRGLYEFVGTGTPPAPPQNVKIQ